MDDNLLLNALHSSRAIFWTENSALPEAVIQGLWNLRVAYIAKELGANPASDGCPSVPLKRPVPSTNTLGDSRPSKRRDIASEAPHLQRNLSAPAPARKRRRSSKTNSGSGPGLSRTKSTPSHPIDMPVNKCSVPWPVPPVSAPACASHSIPIPAHPRPATRPSIPDCQDMSPFDWLSQTAYLSQSPDGVQMPAISVNPSPIVAHGEFQPQDLSRLSTLAAPGSAWDPYSMSRSVSDSGMTNASTITSEPMSRRTTEEILLDSLQMCRVGSVKSDISGYDFSGACTITDDYSSLDLVSFPESFDPVVLNSLPHVSNTSFSPLSPSQSLPQSLPSSSVEMLPSQSQEINATDSSSDSSQPSRPRKGKDKHAPSERLIAPKTPSEKRSSSMQAPKIVEVVAADGTRQTKAQIVRAHQLPKETSKVYCPLCNDHAGGFHGEHELHRHIGRAHNRCQKVWICKDISEDGTFLANCKHCRGRKTYGANYNAAAHLRRVHFKPCATPKGGRGNVSQHRGGIGGGKDPPMEVLRKWMYQIEEVNLNGLLLDGSQVSNTTYMSPQQSSSSSTTMPLETDSVETSSADIEFVQPATNLDMSCLRYTTNETYSPTTPNSLALTQPDLFGLEALFMN